MFVSEMSTIVRHLKDNNSISCEKFWQMWNPYPPERRHLGPTLPPGAMMMKGLNPAIRGVTMIDQLRAKFSKFGALMDCAE